MKFPFFEDAASLAALEAKRKPGYSTEKTAERQQKAREQYAKDVFGKLQDRGVSGDDLVGLKGKPVDQLSDQELQKRLAADTARADVHQDRKLGVIKTLHAQAKTQADTASFRGKAALAATGAALGLGAYALSQRSKRKQAEAQAAQAQQHAAMLQAAQERDFEEAIMQPIIGSLIERKLTAAARNALPDSAFAVPEKRALPLADANHVRNAIARLDQTDLTPGQKAEALKRIKAAAKQHGVEMAEAVDSNQAAQDFRSKFSGARAEAFGLIQDKLAEEQAGMVYHVYDPNTGETTALYPHVKGRVIAGVKRAGKRVGQAAGAGLALYGAKSAISDYMALEVPVHQDLSHWGSFHFGGGHP